MFKIFVSFLPLQMSVISVFFCFFFVFRIFDERVATPNLNTRLVVLHDDNTESNKYHTVTVKICKHV